MRLALYQPDIPQNAGAIMRLAACFDLALDIIEPCGFVLSDKRMRRAGMDYANAVDLHQHTSWEAYLQSDIVASGRLILLTTKSSEPYTNHTFTDRDILLLGRESAGVPEDVHDRADVRLYIPLKSGMRSLNVAMAAAIVTGEAIRQQRV